MSRMRGRQSGITVFEVDARDEETAAAEARRYAAQYAEDGPVQVQGYNGKRWSNLWTTYKDIDPTDVSKLVATVDQVLKAGAPQRPGEWFIARISPLREFKAVQGLAEIGISTYCPCETKFRGKAQVRRKVKTPLLMGYVFLFVPEGRGFWDIHLIDGVHSFLTGAHGQPKPVATADIERFRSRELKGKYDHTINAKDAKKETERLKANFGDLLAMGHSDGVAMIMAALAPPPDPDDLAEAA